MVYGQSSFTKRITMNLLQKIFGGSPAASPQNRYYIFSVKCLRCKEIIEGRVDLNNDLSVEYEEGGDVYCARKTLMGENRCFQRMKVELKFTSSRELLERHVTGGEFTS
jgi:hypothetical protein